MIERIWNPAAGKSFDDFNRRVAACDSLLDHLLSEMDGTAVGDLSKKQP